MEFPTVINVVYSKTRPKHKQFAKLFMWLLLLTRANAFNQSKTNVSLIFYSHATTLDATILNAVTTTVNNHPR